MVIGLVIAAVAVPIVVAVVIAVPIVVVGFVVAVPVLIALGFAIAVVFSVSLVIAAVADTGVIVVVGFAPAVVQVQVLVVVLVFFCYFCCFCDGVFAVAVLYVRTHLAYRPKPHNNYCYVPKRASRNALHSKVPVRIPLIALVYRSGSVAPFAQDICT